MVRYLLLVFGGVAVGGSLGFLGGGGTILTVPILLLAGASAKEAIAISLAVVAASAAVAAAAHARAGRVDWRAALLFGPPAALCGFAGGRAAELVEGEILLLAFTALMFTVGVSMLRPRPGGGTAGGAPLEDAARGPDPTLERRPRPGSLALQGAAIGAITGLVGAGGGFLFVPAFALLGGLSMRRAVGTSLVVVTLNSLAALAGHLGHVSIHPGLAATITAGASLGAWGGARVAGRTSERGFRRTFGIVILLVALWMLGRSPWVRGLAASPGIGGEAPPAAAAHADAWDYDLAIRGGTLYTGGFEMAGAGDVAVRGDRIVAVGSAPGRARREIDARGKVVAPGFIDLHNHTDMGFSFVDWLPLPASAREIRNFLTQGVTTIVTGNCGSGPATPEAVAEWLARADETPFGTNVVHLVPHGQLRLDVMGARQADRADPRPSATELAEMEAILEASLRAGAWGLSTGLEYDPGARAATNELVELAGVVSRHGGVYASHTRHEGPDPGQTLASYAEAIEIGERAGVTVQISHIKASGRAVHGLSARIIDLVEAAHARGVRVFADQYPYAASSTGLSQVVPVEMRDGAAVLPRFCDESGRPRLREAVARTLAEELPVEAILVSAYPWKWWLQGKTVAQIAAERGEDPVDVAMDLACGWPGFGIYFTQSEDDVRRFMTRDWVATASDGLAVSWPLGRYVHPRVYGTFPRKLRRYVYDEAIVPLPFALRSMTELPAEAFRIPGRGRLAVGFHADVVVFDPERIRDRATFEHSGVESEGIDFLLVNGVLAVEEGKVTGARAGRALRRGGA